MTDLVRIKHQHKLTAQASLIEIPQVFLDKFPDLKPAKADKLFHRYLEVVATALLSKLPFLQDGETHLSTEDLLHDCKKFVVKGATFHVYNEFKDIYPLFTVVSKGSNLRSTNNPFEKNTRVRVVNERFLTMLLEEKSPKTVFAKFYENVTEQDMDRAEQIPIDMENLERFIGNCEIELESATGTKHRAKLQGNLWQAQIVHKIGQYTLENIGVAVLPMIPSPSAFGRTYYNGMNIQNVSKQVRSAIIGPHYQYDMNAAVFGIKLYLYGLLRGGDNNIVGTPDGSYTRQYLAEKKIIRERLARECFEGIDVPRDTKIKAIKNALTAIGFGARTGGSFYPTAHGTKATALGELLISPVVRERFLADPFVQQFVAEQKAIEDVLIAAAEAGPNVTAMYEAAAGGNNANGKVTRGGKLAWIYQQEETVLMDAAVQVLNQYGIQPVCRIHDAFIVKEKLSATVLDDIAYTWGLRDYLSLDCDEVREWMDPAFKRQLIRADADLAAHQAWIAQEEAGAQKKAALKRAGWHS